MEKQLDTVEKSLSNISYHLHKIVEALGENQCKCNKDKCCDDE